MKKRKRRNELRMSTRVDIIRKMNDAIAELELNIVMCRHEKTSHTDVMLKILQLRYESRDRLVAMEPPQIQSSLGSLPTSSVCCST